MKRTEEENLVESDVPTEERRKKKKTKKKHEPPVEANIQFLPNNPDKTAPSIGYFPSGFNPHKVGDEQKNREDDSSTIRPRVYRSQIKPRRMELVVSPKGSKVEFVGTNYSGEATAGHQHCSYALGVLDKATQSLMFVPVAANMIFRLETKVGGLESDKERVNSVPGELSVQEKADKRRELTNLYGTKKSISQAKKAQSLRQKDDPESQKDLDGRIKNLVVNKEALADTSAESARNIPPFNVSATTPQAAYPLDKIILTGDWDYLDDIYNLLQAGPEVKTEAYPTFVRNRIYKLRDIEDVEEKKTQSCILSFINHLIKFRDQNCREGTPSAKGHKIPSILRQRFLSLFMEPGSKWMPAEKRDLIISYVLVLTLFADEFGSDPSDIANDLRIKPTDLRPHYDRLGCKRVLKNNAYLATLPIPLTFPELKQKRRP